MYLIPPRLWFVCVTTCWDGSSAITYLILIDNLIVKKLIKCAIKDLCDYLSLECVLTSAHSNFGNSHLC